MPRFDFTKLRKYMACSLALVAVATTVVAASARADEGAVALREAIEAKGTFLLSQHLEAARFLFYAHVGERVGDGTKASGQKVHLPFVPVDVDVGLFRAAGDKGEPQPADYAFSLTLVLDNDVDEAVAKTVIESLKDRFEVDGTTRKLVTRRAKLYAPKTENARAKGQEADASAARPPTEREKADIDLARLEAEAAKARLEGERARIEASKKEVEYQRNLANLEATIHKQDLPKGDAGARDGKGATSPPAKSALDLIGNLQFVLVGLFGLVGILVAGFSLGGSVKKGMAAVGQGLEAVGTGIGDAAKQTAEAQAQATDAGVEAKAGATEGAAAPLAAELLGAATDWLPGHKEHDEFVDMVRDKIDVLVKERSLFLRQVVTDLMEEPDGAQSVVSLLLALPDASARLLIADLPGELTANLKSILQRPAAVSRAKAQRHVAIQDFYGRIAAEEFAGQLPPTPAGAIWLARLSTAELREAVIKLGAEKRPVLLACLTPTRVAKLLADAVGDERQALIQAVGGLSGVTADQIQAFQAETAEDQAKASQRSAVDQTRYVEKLSGQLGPEDQQSLLNALEPGSKAHTLLSRRVVPFAVVKACPQDLVKEMFAKRSAQQTASILYAAPEDLRSHVLATLPAIKAEAVRDELKVMTGKTFYDQRYRSASLLAQRDVTAYLVKLADDGFIDLQALLKQIGPETPRSVAGAA